MKSGKPFSWRYIKGDKIMMLKQTKIVASISDERCEVEFIRDLFKAGMNVVRMNTGVKGKALEDETFRVWKNVVKTMWETKREEMKLREDNDGIPLFSS